MSTTAAERCPQCQQDGCLKSLSIGGCAYQFCSLCDYGNGVDDTVDDVMLAAIIASSVVDGGSPQCGAKVTIYACKTCGNDDVNLQKIVAFDEAADSMNVTVECMECHKMETMTYGCGDGANSNVDPSRGTSLSTRPKLESDSDFYSADDDSNESDVSPNAEMYFVSNGEDGFPVSGIDDAHDDEGLPRHDSAYYRLESEQTVSQRSTDWLSCGKCNNGNWESFDLEFNPVTGHLERAHCRLCDCAVDIPVDPQPATSDWFVECENCGNTDEQRFFKILNSSGDRLLSLHCLSCSAFHDFDRRPKSRFGRGLFRFATRRGGAKRTPRNSDCGHRKRAAAAVRSATRLAKDEDRRLDCSRERITDLGQLRRGDHICWYRWYAIFHHAIVVEVDCKKQQLTVIHNSGSLKPLNGKLASVRLEEINVNPTREDLFRCTYRTNSDAGDSAGLVCYPPDVVVERAASRLYQTYNPLTFNCEHFAQWCRIGRQVSGQVQTFWNRVASAGRSAAACASKALNAIDFPGPAGNGINKPGKSLLSGEFATGLIVNVAVESMALVQDLWTAYRKYRSGDISLDDFQHQLAETGCERIGGIIGGCALGIVGALFIPIPFVGLFIGTTLGNLIGRWCGAVIGKQLVKVK